jgi:hypothetical protein
VRCRVRHDVQMRVEMELAARARTASVPRDDRDH